MMRSLLYRKGQDRNQNPRNYEQELAVSPKTAATTRLPTQKTTTIPPSAHHPNPPNSTKRSQLESASGPPPALTPSVWSVPTTTVAITRPTTAPPRPSCKPFSLVLRTSPRERLARCLNSLRDCWRLIQACRASSRAVLLSSHRHPKPIPARSFFTCTWFLQRTE